MMHSPEKLKSKVQLYPEFVSKNMHAINAMDWMDKVPVTILDLFPSQFRKAPDLRSAVENQLGGPRSCPNSSPAAQDIHLLVLLSLPPQDKTDQPLSA
jgi:hypothetical protein